MHFLYLLFKLRKFETWNNVLKLQVIEILRTIGKVLYILKAIQIPSSLVVGLRLENKTHILDDSLIIVRASSAINDQ